MKENCIRLIDYLLVKECTYTDKGDALASVTWLLQTHFGIIASDKHMLNRDFNAFQPDFLGSDLIGNSKKERDKRENRELTRLKTLFIQTHK